MLFEDQVKSFADMAVLNLDDDMTLCVIQLSRCGHFERVYPSANSDSYKKYFEIEVDKLITNVPA